MSVIVFRLRLVSQPPADSTVELTDVCMALFDNDVHTTGESLVCPYIAKVAIRK